MSAGAAPALAGHSDEIRRYVLERYEERIRYYWSASRYNKRAYKFTRYLTVFLGALVTLISSLASADFVKTVGWLAVAFAVLTPVFAASLAMVGGFAQSFQWGAAWSDMVLAAQRLERERDRIAVTPDAEWNAERDLATLNEITLTETRSFFERILGSGTSSGKPQPGATG